MWVYLAGKLRARWLIIFPLAVLTAVRIHHLGQPKLNLAIGIVFGIVFILWPNKWINYKSSKE